MGSFQNAIIALCLAASLTACAGADEAPETKSIKDVPAKTKIVKIKGSRLHDLKKVSADQTAACIASSTSKRASDKVGNEKTCTLQIPERVTMKIFKSDEPGCRPIVIGVGPKSETIRAVRLVTSHNDGKKYYSSVSLRNRALPDRLSGWVYYGAIDGYPEEACGTLDFKLEEILCKRGLSFSAEYEACDIRVEPPEMFKSFDMKSK